MAAITQWRLKKKKKTQRNEIAKKKENGPRTTKETGGGLSSVFVLFLFFFGGWLRVGEDEKQTKNDETHDRPTRHNATRPATEKRLRTETRPAPALYWKKTAEKKRRQGRRFLLGVTVCVYDVFLSLSLSLCVGHLFARTTPILRIRVGFFFCLFVCFFVAFVSGWRRRRRRHPDGPATGWPVTGKVFDIRLDPIEGRPAGRFRVDRPPAVNMEAEIEKEIPLKKTPFENGQTAKPVATHWKPGKKKQTNKQTKQTQSSSIPPSFQTCWNDSVLGLLFHPMENPF